MPIAAYDSLPALTKASKAFFGTCNFARMALTPDADALAQTNTSRRRDIVSLKPHSRLTAA